MLAISHEDLKLLVFPLDCAYLTLLVLSLGLESLKFDPLLLVVLKFLLK
jgi:hypothetical protein